MSKHFRVGASSISSLIGSCFAILCLGGMAPADAAAQTQDCITCHEQQNPGIVAQLHDSKHGEAGISCIDCHQAGDDNPGGFEHYGR